MLRLTYLAFTLPMIFVGCAPQPGCDPDLACGSGSDSATTTTSASGSDSNSGTTTATTATTSQTTGNTTDSCTGGAPGPTPSCDDGCLGGCGCDGCIPGANSCDVSQAVPRTTMNTCAESGTCVDVVPCAADRTCILLPNEIGSCSDVLTCDEVQSYYDTLVGLNDACQTDDDCRLLNGQCGVGLGGCYEPVGPYTFNGDFYATQAVLDELGQQWAALQCGGAVCDCAAPPAAGATCDAGTCVVAP